jgi:hypothetical protein
MRELLDSLFVKHAIVVVHPGFAADRNPEPT